MRARRREREALESIDRENHPLDARIVVSHGQILLEGEIGKQMPLAGRNLQPLRLAFDAILHRRPQHRRCIRSGR